MKVKTVLNTSFFLFVIAVAIWDLYPQADALSSPKKQAPLISVKAITLQQKKIHTSREALGNLIATEHAMLTVSVPGQVAKVMFTPGSYVKKGTPLIQLDDALNRVQLHAANAALKLSQATYQRRHLLERKGLEAKSALDEALANLSAARAKVATEQAQLDHMTVRAPFDGYIGVSKVSVGEYVGVGHDMVELVNKQHLIVSYEMPERFRHQLKLNQKITVKSDSLPGEVFQAHLSYISPATDPNSRTVALQATLDNTDGVLAPGGFVTVQQEIGDAKSVFVIPEEAMLTSIKGHYVYKIEGKKASKVFVEIADHADHGVVITKGLQRGDQVVSQGIEKLYDGAQVKIT